MRLPIAIATDLKDADLVVTSKNYYRRKPQKLRDAELAGLPLYVLKSNALSQMKQLLDSVYADEEKASALRLALREAEEGIAQVIQGKKAVELSPQSAYIRRLQHLMAERCHLSSRSRGKEPYRRVEIFREGV
jgi:hypothetical protein